MYQGNITTGRCNMFNFSNRNLKYCAGGSPAHWAITAGKTLLAARYSRAVIRVSGHNIGHIFPPTLATSVLATAFHRSSDSISTVAKADYALCRGKWRSYAHREISNCFQFRPDGVMPTLILFVSVGLTCMTKALRIMFAPYSASAWLVV